MLDIMYERLSDDEQSRIMRKLADAGRRARVQKQERLQAELARIRERLDREEEDRRESSALQARIEQRKLEKQRAEILARMQRRTGSVHSGREKSLEDKFVEAVATSDAVRKVAIAAQEVANSQLNPMSMYMRLGNLAAGNGYRTGLEDVVTPKTRAERAIGAGTRVLFDTLAAGAYTKVLAGSKYAKKAYDEYRNYYEGRQLARSYDKLSKNPFKGEAEDVVTVIRPRDQDALYVQRGYAVRKGEEQVVTQGRALKPDTISNFGMNKIMRTHGMTKSEVRDLPRVIRENKPAEVTLSGRQTYQVTGKKGEDYRIATSPKYIRGRERQNLSSFYEYGTEKTSVSNINWTPLPRVYKSPK